MFAKKALPPELGTALLLFPSYLSALPQNASLEGKFMISVSNWLFYLLFFWVALFGAPFEAFSETQTGSNATASVLASASRQASDVDKESRPFGSNLFQGHFSQSKTNTSIQSGDRLVVRLWGSKNFDGILTVTPDGMIHLPEFENIPVGGLPVDPKDQLEQALQSKLHAAGIADVQLYVRPLDIQPISVFVTGFVPNPGSYAGTPSDTILSFLDQAGGIDFQKGTCRAVKLIRQSQEVGTFDLYPFLLKGSLPYVRFQDGDTIVVGEKGPSVVVTGEARNAARFEFKKNELTGAALSDLADPLPRASHVSLVGARNGAPYNLYLPLQEFHNLRLENGDQIRFLADNSGDTIMIEAQGAIRGASRFPVRRNARLRDIQSYIAVEPGRANLKGLYIKRRSVAVRQKKAIEDALRRLEQNAYTATSASPDEAQIRAKEAEMLSTFIAKAREVEPEGIVVVGYKGNIADLALEDGDVIVIPEKTDVVLISGEVMMPQAIVWNRDKDIDDYIHDAGGFSNRADVSKILVVQPSGEVFTNPSRIYPGDQILVLPKVESKNLQAIKDISQVLYQIAVACKVILDI